MGKTKVQQKGRADAAVLPGFEEIRCLWEGDRPPFRSEQAVRWQIRRLGKKLAEAQALAYFDHGLWVHQERFCQVVSEDAIGRFNERFL